MRECRAALSDRAWGDDITMRCDAMRLRCLCGACHHPLTFEAVRGAEAAPANHEPVPPLFACLSSASHQQYRPSSSLSRPVGCRIVR